MPSDRLYAHVVLKREDKTFRRIWNGEVVCLLEDGDIDIKIVHRGQWAYAKKANFKCITLLDAVRKQMVDIIGHKPKKNTKAPKQLHPANL